MFRKNITFSTFARVPIKKLHYRISNGINAPDNGFSGFRCRGDITVGVECKAKFSNIGLIPFLLKANFV